MNKQKLHLEILPTEQRTLWDELGGTPNHFTLYGGTALALQLGHRESIDFDFFSKEKFDPLALSKKIPYLKDYRVTQEAENTLSVHEVVNGKKVNLSFFGDIDFTNAINPPILADNGISIASKEDIAGTKINTITRRAEEKDYIDIHALIKDGMPLSKILQYGKQVYGNMHSNQISLKALVYFKELPDLKDDIKKYLITAVNKYNKTKEKSLDR